MNLEEGAVVAGRYRVGKTLGRGGQGAVYQAWDQRLDEWVALKVTLAGGPAAAEVEARFAREAQLSNRLGRDQPRIVRARDWARLDAERLYLVMDLVDGARPLDLKSGDAPARVARVREAATLVAAMHAAGAVHRDLKPANLLQSADGRVHLTDLGLAKVVGEAAASRPEQGLTQTGQGMGTPGFMPIEQFSDAASADARADVWALGCMLFAALCGRLPFGGGMSEVLSHLMRIKHREVASPRPRDHDPAVPAPLDDLVAVALAIDPAARHADAGAFVQALDAATSAAGWPAASVTPVTTTERVLKTSGAPVTETPGDTQLRTGALQATEIDRGVAEATEGAQALSRRARRLAATPFVAAPGGCLGGLAGGMLALVLASSSSSVREDDVADLCIVLTLFVTPLAVANALLEVAARRRGLRLAFGAIASVALAIVAVVAREKGEAAYVVAIGAAALLSLVAVRGVAAWTVVAAIGGLAAAVATAVCLLLSDTWTVHNLGLIPAAALATATAAAVLALIDRLDGRLAGDAPARRPGGWAGAGVLVVPVLGFVAAAVMSKGWIRPPVDLSAPDLEVLTAEASRDANGRAWVRVRCSASDLSPCEVRLDVGPESTAETRSDFNDPIDLALPWPDGFDGQLRVSVSATDASGNVTYRSQDVLPPPVDDGKGDGKR